MTETEIMTEFGQRAPDSPVTDAQKLLWANDGARDIARRTKTLRTSGSINLVAGTANYDLIDSFATFLAIDPDGGVAFYDGNDYLKLAPKSKDWLDTYVAGWRNAQQGDPIAYYREGKDLYTYPTSASNYTAGLLVYYFKMPAEMTAASSDDPFDDRTELEPYHDLIILYMLWKAKQSIGEYQQANMARGEYIGEINRMINELGEEPEMDEPFRPYSKVPIQTHSHPNLWGVE